MYAIYRVADAVVFAPEFVGSENRMMVRINDTAGAQ